LLREVLRPDHTVLQLSMLSLVPQDALDELERQFGPAFSGLDEIGRLALVTAQVEGNVTNQRLREITGQHPVEVTKRLRALVDQGFLGQFGATRGTFYSLPPVTAKSDHERSISDHLRPRSDQVIGVPELAALEVIPAVLAVRARGMASPTLLREAVVAACSERFLSLRDLSSVLHRSVPTLRRHVAVLLDDHRLELRFPDQPNHPQQEYRAK
jgi:hypothetical protein